jgi:hypothetical protein
MSERHNKIAFGDFQTPLPLARDVCSLLRQSGIHPRTVIEPTCGEGSFIEAAIEAFGSTPQYYGFDINPEYIASAKCRLQSVASTSLHLHTSDFFTFDWHVFLKQCEKPILLLGNPPWVTNAMQGTIGADNLPEKSNLKGLSGLNARTGKANFDISEWMLLRLFEALSEQNYSLGMLCKTGVARKVLEHGWRNGKAFQDAAIYRIDTASWFGAAVDACLFTANSVTGLSTEQIAHYYASLSAPIPDSRFGLQEGQLVANIEDYRNYRYLNGISHYRWRSGVKHDLAKVMELSIRNSGIENGFGEMVDLEERYKFPLLKCTEVSKGISQPSRYVLIPQSAVGENTGQIRTTAPKTWDYLARYREAFSQRKSSIYRNQPEFAIFGVGPYSFAPYKIAVSSLHKEIRFTLVPPYQGKPVLFDDTCYFVGVDSQEEAELLLAIYSSQAALRFLRSLVFPDSKRPVTAEILNRLNILPVAEALGRAAELETYLHRGGARTDKQGQLVFDPLKDYSVNAKKGT